MKARALTTSALLSLSAVLLLGGLIQFRKLYLTADDFDDAEPDPPPPGALARIGGIRLKHGGNITALAFSSDMKTLVSAGRDRTIRFWDAATGREVRRFTSKDDYFRVHHLALSPDSKMLAFWTATHQSVSVHLWDAVTGKELRLTSRGGCFFTFAADSKTLISWSGTTIALWDVKTGRKHQEWQGPKWDVGPSAGSS